MDPYLQPDVLVLAAGGVLGEAWMSGVLAGIEDGADTDFRRAESFVGTSAGSIVAATLAAGRRPRRPRDTAAEEREEPDAQAGSMLAAAVTGAARWGWAASGPVTQRVVARATPIAGLARAAVLSRAPDSGRRLDALHAEITRSGVRFDGRLRVCAVDRRRGRRVVFGAPGAPPAAVADAVAASCAIPWVFAPVTIGDRQYVDGGAWSVTNLDAAPALRDTHVLCLDPTMNVSVARLGALRHVLRAAAAVEIQSLRRRGAHVRRIGADARCAALMGADLMDPRPADRVLAAGYRQGRALAT